MAIKKISSSVDFISQEHEVLEFWKNKGIFDKRRELNKGKKKWSFIDGPITANNPMGVHHAWGRTLKDIYNRYKSMAGYELRYQNGFDCQGLWVEIEVEKELGFKSKKDVEDFGIEKFVNLCKERVLKYSKIQTEQSIRLGYWMDWENSYFTMSDDNNYTIWGFLKKLYEEQKIYRDVDVVPWSGRSGTSYSQMEVIEGRKLVSHRSVFVRFPIKDKEKEYLLVWTTTPWTLTSNVVVAVNVNLEYVKLKSSDGSIYYFAKDNLEYQRLEKQFAEKKQWIDGVPKLKTIAQIFKEHGGYEVLGSVKGSDLVGLEYIGPYDDLDAQNTAGGYPYVNETLEKNGITSVMQHKVIDPGKDKIGNDIVVSGEGTGIVHMAPGCGDVDHKVGKEKGLINIAPLDEEARFMDDFGWLKHKSATDPETIDLIIEDLKKRQFLVYVEEYPHVYPHCWRSGDELVFRLVEEWYINMDWREKIKKVVDDVNWIPNWGKEREHEWLDNMGDWMISKKRFWGLALPIWVFEDDSFYVVGSEQELKDLAVSGYDEFKGNSPHRPWVDNIQIRHPESGLIGKRILDVGNPWLDAGIVPFSTLNYMSDKEHWKDWYPADFVTECFPGQFRNWFYSLLAMSSWLDESAPFKTLLGHALVKDENGREMHKSWGNAIWFDDAAEKMGVDVMRWMYAGQNLENNLLFGYGPADEIRKKLITFWNVYSFFSTYASVDGFDLKKHGKINNENLTILDKWVLSKLHIFIKNCREFLDDYDVASLVTSFDTFIEELSNWYIRRNRRRFWKSEDDQDKFTAYATLYHVLVNSVKCVAPVLPFCTEKMYENLVLNLNPEAPESVHLCDYPSFDADLIDEDIIQKVDSLKRVVELGRSARNQSKVKIRQPLLKVLYAIEDNKTSEFIDEYKTVILDELNVKSIERITNAGSLVKYNIKPNLPVLGRKYKSGLKDIRDVLNTHDNDELFKSYEETGVIVLEKNNNTYKLEKEDIIIETLAAEGFSAVSGDGITVGLSLELNEDLIQEGIVRDLVRQIQNIRKDAGFSVEDRIIISWELHGEFQEAISKFEQYFCNETLTTSIDNDIDGDGYKAEFHLKEQLIKVSVRVSDK